MAVLLVSRNADTCHERQVTFVLFLLAAQASPVSCTLT